MHYVTFIMQSNNGMNTSRPTYSSSWFIKQHACSSNNICIYKINLIYIIILNTLINTSYIYCNQYIYFDMPPERTPSPCAKCVCGSRLPMSIKDTCIYILHALLKLSTVKAAHNPIMMYIKIVVTLICCVHCVYAAAFSAFHGEKNTGTIFMRHFNISPVSCAVECVASAGWFYYMMCKIWKLQSNYRTYNYFVSILNYKI